MLTQDQIDDLADGPACPICGADEGDMHKPDCPNGAVFDKTPFGLRMQDELDEIYHNL